MTWLSWCHPTRWCSLTWWQVSYPDGTVCGVDVLAARPAGPLGLNLQVFICYLNVYLPKGDIIWITQRTHILFLYGSLDGFILSLPSNSHTYACTHSTNSPQRAEAAQRQTLWRCAPGRLSLSWARAGHGGYLPRTWGCHTRNHHSARWSRALARLGRMPALLPSWQYMTKF